MDVWEYFRRIGFSGPFVKPDLSTLKQLLRLHVTSVPFENLSLHCGEEMPVDLSRTWDKIVMRGRGGWCFESGALFLWALAELGYDTTMLSSRVYHNQSGQFSEFDDHLIGKVKVEGREFIVDASFGFTKQIREPLELEPGKEQIQTLGTFRFLKTGHVWVLEKTSRDPKILDPSIENSKMIASHMARPVYRFTLEPKILDYFFEANKKLLAEPDSVLVNKLLVSLQCEDGVKLLVGQVYSHMTCRPDLGLDLFDMREVQVEELETLLREQFNLRLENKLRLMDKKM